MTTYVSDLEKVTRTCDAGEFPTVFILDNFNGCNLHCSMCDHKNMKNYRKIQKMDMGLYRKIIDEIAVKNPSARVWNIFFGDPFLVRDMPERVRYAKDKGLTDVVLNTNGVLMKPEKSRPLIEAGLDAMYVGIDAAKEETYNQIRCGGDFKATIENVLAYRDLLKQYGRPEQKLFVQFVVADINADETEDFRSFWMERGVNVKIRPKVSWAGLVEATNLRPNAEVERKPCYWLMWVMNICADGEATFCSVDVHCRIKCGNVRDRSISEVWNDRLKTYRDMHREGRYDELPDLCKNCSDWQSTYAEFS